MSERTLVDELLDRWEEARSAGWLLTPETLCENHPALIETVRSRINALAGVNDLLDTSAATWGETTRLAGQTPAPREGHAAQPILPDGLGMRYCPKRFHARGHLGEVFLAVDGEVNRPVALKFIQNRIATDPVALQRFRMEAEITGRLEHPGVVPVYGVVEAADGRPCYAMRFVRGETLAERITAIHGHGSQALDESSREVELRRLLRRFIHVCQTVGYAHSRGVIHRDLKPANILLGPYDETLVVDWGLAKPVTDPVAVEPPEAVRDGSDPSMLDTLFGPLLPISGSSLQTLGMVGTPAFMSSEQADMSRLGEVGPLTDVYALGAVLYSILTGKPPVQGRDLKHVLDLVKRGQIKPPRSHDPGISKSLEVVCQKAMARDPASRYATPQALVEDLERWLADEPVSVYREPLSQRAWRWVRRHQTLSTAAASVLLVSLLALGIAWRREAEYAEQTRKSNVELLIANSATKQAEQLAERRLDLAMGSIESYYTGVSEEALTGGQLPDDLRDQLLEMPLHFYEHLTAELEAKANPTEREWELLADGRYSLGSILVTLGRNAEAEHQFEAALIGFESLSTNAGEHQADLVRSLSGLGLVLDRTGRADEAIKSYNRAVSSCEALIERQPDEPENRIDLARILTNLGGVLRSTGRSDESIEAYERAVELGEALVMRHPDSEEPKSKLVNSLNGLGSLLQATGRSDQAIDTYARATEMGETLVALKPDNNHYQDVFTSLLINYGGVLRKVGRYDDSISTFDRAVEIGETLVERQPMIPEYRNRLAHTLNGLGNVLYTTGRYEEAVTTLNRAIGSCDDLVNRHPDVPSYRNDLANTHNVLGVVLRATGQTADSIEAYDRAITIYGDLVEQHPNVPEYKEALGNSLTNLSHVLRSSGKLDEAISAQMRAVDSYSILVERHPDSVRFQDGLARSLNSLGILYRASGQVDEAIEQYRRSIRVAESLVQYDPDVPDYRATLGTSLSNLANILRKSRSGFEEAIDVYDRAIANYQVLAEKHPKNPDYQDGLANSRNGLGILLISMNRSEEAVETLQQAIESYQKLVAQQPDRPLYRGLLGGAVNNLGLAFAKQGNDEEAVPYYRKAIEHQRKAIDLSPQVTEYQGYLSNHYSALGKSLRSLGRAEEAAQAAREYIEIEPDDPRQLYNGACSLSLCVPLLDDDTMARAREVLAAEAVATLRRAVTAGWSRASWTARDRDLLPLHDRADFQRVLEDLLDRGFPAEPFAP